MSFAGYSFPTPLPPFNCAKKATELQTGKKGGRGSEWANQASRETLTLPR